jgi:hypothetical protein
LRREMQATMQRVGETSGKEPGTGNIRGIGAERRVDGKVCEGGTMDREFSSFLFSSSIFLRVGGSRVMRNTKRNATKQTTRIKNHWGGKVKKVRLAPQCSSWGGPQGSTRIGRL